MKRRIAGLQATRDDPECGQQAQSAQKGRVLEPLPTDVGGPDRLRYRPLLDVYTAQAGLKRHQVDVLFCPPRSWAPSWAASPP